MITWDTRTLYDEPVVGTCEISGAYETGRFYKQDGKPIFIGSTKAPTVVDRHDELVAALGAVTEFKRGYSKKGWNRGR